jgi:nitroimidazol reductase NimA-like FMN-containing flavoprotein (pyridoxamine 5'-phosphate oxidase superfamily)
MALFVRMKFSAPQVQGYLDSQKWGRLALSTPQAKPHLTAIGYAFDTEKIYMYMLKTSKKVRLVKKNPQSSFIVDDTGGEAGWRYVMVEGTASIVNDSNEFEYATKLICERYPQIVGTDWRINSDTDEIIVFKPEKVLTANI